MVYWCKILSPRYFWILVPEWKDFASTLPSSAVNFYLYSAERQKKGFVYILPTKAFFARDLWMRGFATPTSNLKWFVLSIEGGRPLSVTSFLPVPQRRLSLVSFPIPNLSCDFTVKTHGEELKSEWLFLFTSGALVILNWHTSPWLAFPFWLISWMLEW